MIKTQIEKQLEKFRVQIEALIDQKINAISQNQSIEEFSTEKLTLKK